MYNPNHFEVHELVDPFTYERFGDRAIRYMNDSLMKILEFLREKLGPITVNNYHWGGDRQWSGLRTPASPWYSTYSGHSFGIAIDFKCKNHTPNEVRKFIKDNWEEISDYSGAEGIRLEHGDDAPTWVHIDVMHSSGVYTFRK